MHKVVLSILLFFVFTVGVAAEELHRSPVYLNWEFWSAICAAR